MPSNAVSFAYGLQSAYDSAVKSESMLYFITDTNRIYKGSTLITQMNVVFTSTEPQFNTAVNGYLYVYTNEEGKTSLLIKGTDSMTQVGGGEATTVADGVLDLANFQSGVVVTSLDDSATDSSIPTAKAVKDYVSGLVSTLTNSVNTAFDDVQIVAGGEDHPNQFGLSFTRVGNQNPITVYLDKEQYLLDAEVGEGTQAGTTGEQCLILTVQISDGQGGTSQKVIEIPLTDLVQVNASTVDTTQQIFVTTPVGNYEVGDVINPEDIQTILTNMLCQPTDPTITSNPSISVFRIINGTSYEVGTTVTPQYTATFSGGSYSFKSTATKEPIEPTDDEGVIPESWVITQAGAEIYNEATSEVTVSGSGTAVQVTESGVNFNASCTHDEGNYALTNINTLPEEDVMIPSGTVQKSVSISGFRQGYFYGVLSTTSSEAPLTSDIIRGGTKKGSAYSKGNLPLISASSVGSPKRVFVACPATNTGVTKVIMPSAMNADCTNDFVKLSDPVSVEGADGYTGVNYNVWVYEPASISLDQTFTVTLG